MRRGSSNVIHRTALISGDVDLGSGNEILAYSVLNGPLTIGDGNRIGPHVVIGSPAADTREPRHESADARVAIGSGNVIREFTAIQKPRYRDITRIGDECFLMQGTNIPHDVLLDDKVVTAAMAVLGGIVHVMEGAYVGMGCVVHQYSIIGAYAIAGMGSSVVKNIRPFSRYIPGKPISVNHYAIEKFGFAGEADAICRYVETGEAPRADTAPSAARLIASFNAACAGSDRASYA